jgi:hypothetical protein
VHAAAGRAVNAAAATAKAIAMRAEEKRIMLGTSSGKRPPYDLP